MSLKIGIYRNLNIFINNMDVLIKKLIDEVINKTSNGMSYRTAKEIYDDICPHCKSPIFENKEYTEDGGRTWKHTECLKEISPESLDIELTQWAQTYMEEAREEREAARKALTLPPSGEKKYATQEPGGTMNAVNLTPL